LRDLARLGPTIVGRLGRIAYELSNIPELLKGAGNGFRPFSDETLRLGRKWGKKALDEIYSNGVVEH
jgi:hypothetical protein